ncbi:MAG: thymidine kinase [Candidatus Gracilibacteria bacterium]|nr:thymidine kinase [Candidatus Gracilibacteria bacterium]MDD2908246.1 thymidine kinase [Candidatus Gracilibacteria bacterium]
MSKLYFHYGAMGAGKSLELIKVAYNYSERGKSVLIFNSALDTRFKQGEVSSRSGSSMPSITFNELTDFFKTIEDLDLMPDCILIDESQFLTKNQVNDCGRIVTKLNIPVMCYGLRTDFLGNLFEGSKRLMELAQKIEEIKTICWCGCKATMNARISNGNMVIIGEQIEIGENDKYISLCLKHYSENNIGNSIT